MRCLKFQPRADVGAAAWRGAVHFDYRNSTFVGAVLQVGGRMAYAAQQAWIVNATVKGNVTFGRPFDEDRWRMCVEVSAAGCLGC